MALGLMPLYTYRCERGHRAQIRRAPENADRPILCPVCGTRALRLTGLRGLDPPAGPERYQRRHGRD